MYIIEGPAYIGIPAEFYLFFLISPELNCKIPRNSVKYGIPENHNSAGIVLRRNNGQYVSCLKFKEACVLIN